MADRGGPSTLQDADGPPPEPVDAVPPPRRAPSRARQFGAVLRKNYLLQTRSRRWFGGAGGLALLAEVTWELRDLQFLQGCW